ncbi:MAG: hypothetical protein KatS3mg074_036 [Meiothermus sp.]|nr:MAG: hypothetical protein KatS3mg074_036 [Meiothermus sp.]
MGESSVHSIKLSKAWGKAFYYPGYAYKEPSEYDYKKRLGALEYFDWKGNWLKYPAGLSATPQPALTKHFSDEALE